MRDLSRLLRHSRSQFVVIQDGDQPFTEGYRVIYWYVKSGNAILHQKCQPTHLSCDHGGAASHRFERYHAKGFVVRWHHHHVGSGIEIGQRILPAMPEESDQIIQPLLVTKLLQAVSFHPSWSPGWNWVRRQ